MYFLLHIPSNVTVRKKRAITGWATCLYWLTSNNKVSQLSKGFLWEFLFHYEMKKTPNLFYWTLISSQYLIIFISNACTYFSKYFSEHNHGCLLKILFFSVIPYFLHHEQRASSITASQCPEFMQHKVITWQCDSSLRSLKLLHVKYF